MSASKPIASVLLVLLLAAHFVVGSPRPSGTHQDKEARYAHEPKPYRGGGAPDLSCLTLPTIAGAATQLPTPPAGYKLKHVALGVGTQNYTCSGSSSPSSASASSSYTSSNTAAVPSSAGALASLWDIGPFLASPFGRMFENALPPLALAMYGAVEGSPSLWWDAVMAQMPSSSWLDTSDSDSTSSASNSNPLHSTAFGEHFFASVSSTLTPTWDLLPPPSLYPDEAANIVFQAAKVASAPAPAGACPGLTGEGAVPWLYLTATSSTDEGIAAVYRVVTAGGVQPDTCEEYGDEGAEIKVKYAAEYWFYGP